MDADLSETTLRSQTRSPSQYEMEHDATNILSESRSIRVVLYGTSPAETEHRFWVDPEVTFGGIEKALSEMYPSQTAVALEPHWGPRPYWTKSHPLSPIGTTCQCLYAILSRHTRAYILAVVRTSLIDYPVPIYEAPPESSMTLLDAAIASNPKLTGQIRSIIHYIDGRDICNVPYDNDFIASHPSPTTPTTAVLITTLDEPPKDFIVGSLYESFSPSSPKASTSGDLDGLIPPFLQIPFVECKLLVQHAYELDLFPLQMIHLSKAILHVIISLAKSLETVFVKGPNIGAALTADDGLADLLRVAPLLSRQLEGFLDTANGILHNIQSWRCDRREIQRDIESIFGAICGDFPGAVTVRHSHGFFKDLGNIEREEVLRTEEAIGGIVLDTETQSNEEIGGDHGEEENEIDDEADEKHDIENVHDHQGQEPLISTLSGRNVMSAFYPEMSEIQAASTPDIERRIALLDEGARRILKFHSGNRPDGPKLLLEALETYSNQNFAIPVIRIQRKPPHSARQGAMEYVTCGICSTIGTFQKIADHVINFHFELRLWSCGIDECQTSLSRRSDLNRHRSTVHNLATPRQVKAKGQSQASSSTAFPLSPGPGPTRSNTSSYPAGRHQHLAQ